MQSKRFFFIFVFILISFPLIAGAGEQTEFKFSGHFGGSCYSVKLHKHTCDTDATSDDIFYALVGSESGLTIYTNDATPVWVNDFPDPNISSYDGGASGRQLEYFKTGIDAAVINDQYNKPTDYAFYADGKKLYVLDISDATGDISIASEYSKEYIRAVKVAAINGNWFAFAIGYNVGGTGETKLYIFDVNDPTDITWVGEIDLHKTANPNSEGGCDMDFIPDFNNDETYNDPYLFIADGVEGVKSVNLGSLYDDPNDVDEISVPGYILTGGIALGIDVVQYDQTLYAYVADGAGGLKIYDVSDPSEMTLKGSLSFSYEAGYSGMAYDVRLFGTTAFIANGEDGVRIADVSDPNTPVEITYGYNGTQLAYIDSDVSSDRLNGTAYGLDLDISSDGINSSLYPVVAWGEAGVRKMRMKYLEIDNTISNDGTASFKKIVDFIADGTYIWVLDAAGCLSRITPGKTMSVITTTDQVFSDVTNDINGVWGNNIIGNIVSCGDYIYGVDDQSMDRIARVRKTGFSVDSTAQRSYSHASDYTDDFGTCGVVLENYILRLFTNGTDVFFLDYDLSSDPTLRFTSEGEIGRLIISNFSESGDMVETNARIFDTTADISQLKLVVTDHYIYGICYGDATIYGDGSGDCVCQIKTDFGATDRGVSDDTYTGPSDPDICNLVSDANTVCAVDQSGDIICYYDSNWSGISGDAIRNTQKHFRFSATQDLTTDVYVPLYIKDNYIYGRKKDASNCLSRVNISNLTVSSTPSETANFSLPSHGGIAFITGDGHDIYMFQDETGDVYKVAVDRFNTSDDSTSDVIVSENPFFHEADASTDSTCDTTKYVALGGYVFGIDDISNDVLVEVGFRTDETDDKVALKEGPVPGSYYEYYCGYAKDVLLNIDHSSDVFIADGKKGIVKITFEKPADVSSDTGKWFMTRLNDVDGAGEVSGDADIRDARGLDFIRCTDHSADSVLLVADGAAGVKLVKVANVPDAMSLRSDGGSISDGNGYISQTKLGGGIAEDIKYFQFKKRESGSDKEHEYAAVANGYEGVVILDLDSDNDVDDHTQSEIVNMGDTNVCLFIDTNGYAYGLAIDKANDYIYVADGSNGLVVIDLDPDNTGSFGAGNSAMMCDLLDPDKNNVYSAGASNKLRSVILDDPNNPTYAYLAYGSKGVVVLRLDGFEALSFFPSSGTPEGEAYDLAYDATSDTLFVAMSHDEIKVLDVSDPNEVVDKGGFDTYGKTLGIVYGDVDGDTLLSTPPHIFVADGPGGFLSASVKPQPWVTAVFPNIQPVGGGDVIKVIGSGFKQGYTSITISDGTHIKTLSTSQVICNSSFELTFAAPSSPSGSPGQFTIYVYRTDNDIYSLYTEKAIIEYIAAGHPIVALSAETEGAGMGTPGSQAPVDLMLRTNGAGQINTVTARIEYNPKEFDVTSDSGLSAVFQINENIEKNAELDIKYIDANCKILTILIINKEAGVNAVIPDRTYLGTVYFTLTGDQSDETDTTRSLNNGPDITDEQQACTMQGNSVEAIGSKIYIYIKSPPRFSCAYSSEQWWEVGDNTHSFGPFRATVYEYLDSSSYVEGAEITFTTSSPNAVRNYDNPSGKASFTVTQGTLKSTSSDGTSITVYSNASGKATVTLEVGTVAGEYSMNVTGVYYGATIAGSPTTPIIKPFNVYAETDPGDPNDSIALSISENDALTGGYVTITATAYDKYGNPLGPKSDSENLSEKITFTTNRGNLSATTGYTDGNGQVIVSLKIDYAIIAHTVTATYDTTTTSLIIMPEGPDVNLKDGWTGIDDLQQAIIYHKNWTYLEPIVADTSHDYLPGDTNHNHRMDLNEVVAIINSYLGL
ncbi:MAG: hypothetical protein ACMUIP_00950 [bacterium]